MRRIERSPGGTGAAQWPAQEGSGSYPHPTMPRPRCTQCCSRAPLSLLELPMAPGAKIRCWCKEDWCIDCAAGDCISQLLFLPPCWVLTPVLIPKSLSVQRESGSGWGVYRAQSLIYELLLHSTLRGGHIQLRVLWPLNIPLQREKTEIWMGWWGWLFFPLLFWHCQNNPFKIPTSHELAHSDLNFGCKDSRWPP